MDKNKVIEILQSVEVENKEKLQDYLNKVSNMDEQYLLNFMKEKNITTEENLREFVKSNVDSRNNFIALNDMVSYGLSNNTLHIHVVPKDIHSLMDKKGMLKGESYLIDALEKIETLIEQDDKLKDINQVYAISSIIRPPISKLFLNLDFDVKILDADKAREDDEFKFFVDRLLNGKKLGRAKISREKLFSKEWQNLKEDRKKDIDFKSLLQDVNDVARYNIIKDVETQLIESLENDKEKEVIE